MKCPDSCTKIKIAKTAIAAKTDIEQINQNIRKYILIVVWEWAQGLNRLMSIFHLLSNPIPKAANHGNFANFQTLS
jgi:hypothetical protein